MDQEILTGYPVNGQPLGKAAVEAIDRKAKNQRLAASGKTLRDVIDSKEGRKHIQDMMEDYSELVDSLGSNLPFEKFIATSAKIEYIKERLSKWKVTLSMGRVAQEAMAKDFLKGL